MRYGFTPRVVCCACLAVLLLAGCGGGGETPESTAPPPPTETSSPLPTPLPGGSSPIPTPPPGASSPIQTPAAPDLPDWDAEPAPGRAVLRGHIEVTQPTALLGELFLAAAVPTSDPEIDLLELDEDKSPKAEINRSTGEFIFRDVEPGKYGLIAWEPLNSRPLNDPATGATFMFELPADQITDVGTLYFP